MLVDNAIVVIDGMQVRIEGGMDKVKAAKEVVNQNSTPLLGATAVAIMAFAAIGTSQDSTGEYTRSLFTVILMSLGLSWVTAVTTTPLVGVMLLKPKPGAGEGKAADPYAAKPYQMYKKLLETCLRFRYVTAAVVIAVFIGSLIAFGSVKQMFFPGSTRPQFFMEVYFPSGTHIRETERQLAKIEEHVMGLEGVTDVATAIGGGDLRLLLTYTPQDGGASYGAVFVSVEDWPMVDQLIPPLQEALETIVPMATVNVKKFLLGPGEGGRIQLRISGPDRVVLRELAAQARDILRQEGGQGIRDEWREQEKVVVPIMSEAQANRLGIDRPAIAQTIQAAYDGFQTGVYRENDELLPILVRAPEHERVNFKVDELQIWSPAARRMIPLGQVINGTETSAEDATIYRWNRVTTIRVHTDAPFGELNSELLARAKPRIESEMGNGVDLEAYFGRNMGDDALANMTASTIPIRASSIPVFFGLMVLIVIALFNTIRQPLIIWLTVPLALIGVTWGLLVAKQPFGFMALLGFMSLSGMLIKNAIVLIDEISIQRKTKEAFQAVVDSGLSRMRPVSMAALTTILGMVPLLLDAFFVSMAVTIMAGLLVATVLTLLVVPTLYVMFYRVPNPE
jgi:multidrug efflux pump subunit AcrB